MADAAGGEVHHWQTAEFGGFPDQMMRRPNFLGIAVQFIGVHAADAADFAADGAGVADGFDDVAGAGFAFGTHHGGAFADAAQSLAKIAASADKGNVKLPFVDVMLFVGWRQDLALVDIIDSQGLQYLRFDKVSDAGFGHDGNGDSLDNSFNHVGVAHAGDAALNANIGRHALKRHHGSRAGLFGDLRLRWGDDIHNHAALEHLRQTALDLVGAFFGAAILLMSA